MTSGDNSDSTSDFLIRLGKNLGVQYALLIVLFLRTIWGIWNSRDLTTGDTSSYYRTALEFSHSLTCSIAWSPLYTSYFGAFHWLSSDPYFVVTAHRVFLLLLLAILIFEVSRRLLDQLAAWLVTAWWIVLPINHSSLYEVHLFALLPALVFWLLLAVSSSVWVRGACVGLLALCTVLVRNEMLIALGLFGAISVCFDLWQLWCKRTDLSLRNYLAAYGIPLLIAISIILMFYWRSTEKFPELSASLEVKHTLNVAQIYSFGYGQRHPEYTDSPWTQYHTLMSRDFGEDLPSMREAVLANPKAMAEHFLWNSSLIPSGLQVALFNCRSGKYNPDYAPTIQNQNVASSLSALYIILVTMGILLFALHREYWWSNWLAHRVWPVIGILCICVTVVVVMIMQRPRPSYLFPFTLALMWLGALSVKIILRHARFALVPMTLVAFSVPIYFLHPAEGHERPLLTMYRLLQPYRNELSKPGAGVAAAGFPDELTSYLDLGKDGTQANDLNAVIAAMPPDASLHETLRSRDIRFVIIAPYQMGENRVKSFMASAKSLGWKRKKSRRDIGKDYGFYIFTQH